MKTDIDGFRLNQIVEDGKGLKMNMNFTSPLQVNPICSTARVARIEGTAGRHSRRARGKTASEHAASADFKFV